MPPASDAPLVSYAPNGEDVVLWRALGHVTPGWYVDVGAHHPVGTSITKLFSLRGWRGINIEPLPNLVEELQRDRPNDVNLRVAVSDQPGELVLFVVADDLQRTTLSSEFAQMYRDEGHQVVESVTPVRTLSDVLDEHPLPRIDFLKIDAEGMEEAVLRGLDLSRHRPLVIVAEEDFRERPQVPALLADAGYASLLWDGVNRYFVAIDAPERVRQAFRYGANPSLDAFTRHDLVVARERIEELERELSQLTGVSPDARWSALEAAEARVRELDDHIAAIHASATWRVGSALLAPLQWVRRRVRRQA